MRVGPALLILAGCGRIGFDAQVDDGTPQGDGSLGDASLGTGPFSTPTVVDELRSTSSEDDPGLTADLLEIYFDSSRPLGSGRGDVWVARRSTTTEMFGPPAPITELSTSSDESGPWIMPDGLTIYFNSDRPGGQGGFDLYVARRASRAAVWDAPVHIPELATAQDDRAAFVTPDDLTMYFTSTRGGGSDDDIFITTRSTRTEPWGAAAPVSGLSDPNFNEEEHWLSVDLLRVYFTSQRPTGVGARDLWFASRPDLGSPFGVAENIGTLNGAESEADPWLTPDERVVYFTRRNASGDFDLLTATR